MLSRKSYIGLSVWDSDLQEHYIVSAVKESTPPYVLINIVQHTYMEVISLKIKSELKGSEKNTTCEMSLNQFSTSF